MIQTVSGWINKENVKFCHSHEHLFIRKGVPYSINRALRIDDYSLTVKELEMFKGLGGCTIVDAQPLGCGRMEQNLINASQDTGVNIIAATGFHKLSFYPNDHWIWHYNVNELKKIFIHELNSGMYIDTDQKEPLRFLSNRAGFIKTAIDAERIEDKEKKWFIAAAEASIEAGFPIMCHTETKEQATYIADFYISLGVKPEKIILCHLDRRLDQLEIHEKLAELGCYLEYDTIGRFKYHSNEEEAKLLKHMIKAGFEDQILLGLDTTRDRLKSYGAEIGLDHLKMTFIPLLKRLDISDTIINKLMSKNPSLALSKGKGE